MRYYHFVRGIGGFDLRLWLLSLQIETIKIITSKIVRTQQNLNVTSFNHIDDMIAKEKTWDNEMKLFFSKIMQQSVLYFGLTEV